MRTDMNPLLPDVCACDKPIVNQGACMKCGRDLVVPPKPKALA